MSLIEKESVDWEFWTDVSKTIGGWLVVVAFVAIIFGSAWYDREHPTLPEHTGPGIVADIDWYHRDVMLIYPPQDKHVKSVHLCDKIPLWKGMQFSDITITKSEGCREILDVQLH